jgi:MFS superfamily sulfate permease-like transporter
MPPYSKYSRWSPDIIAGISIAGLLLTEAVAYSSIAGLPPQAGVVALFSGLISYGLLGRSRFAIAAATSSSAAVMAAAIASMGVNDIALRIALSVGLITLSGAFFIIASLAKLGGISDFIAKPVLRGFAFGLSLVIITKQLPKIVGVYPPHSDFLNFAFELFSRFQEWNWHGILVASFALLLLFVLSKVRHMPAALVVIALGIGIDRWIDLTVYGIKLVGPIQLALAPPTIPMLDHAQWLRLAELAVAMVLILYAETFGSIQTYALKHGDTTSPNRDLLALGLANIASGLLHGLPVGAGFSATTANETAGAKSRLSGWVCAAVALIIVLTLLPEIAMTPEPVLAAVVIYAVSHSLNFRVFRIYFEIRRDRLVVVASVLCVLFFGVLDGLFAGIVMSLAMMLQRWSASSVSVLGRLSNSHDFASVVFHPEANQIEGILIVRPEEPLFFANVTRILQQVQQAISVRGDINTLILSMEESPDLDSTTVEALTDFAKIIETAGQRLIFVRLKNSAREVLQRTSIEQLSTTLLLDLSVDTAVTTALVPKDVINPC